MASVFVVIFVVGLEVFCLLFGLGLSDTEAPALAWSVWQQALWLIPLAGLAAAWSVGRRSRRSRAGNRAFGVASVLVGSVLSLVWAQRVAAFRDNRELVYAAMVAGMALTSALFLLSAGILLLSTSTPKRAPD